MGLMVKVNYVSPFILKDSAEYVPGSSKLFYGTTVKQTSSGYQGLLTDEPILRGAVVARDGGNAVSGTTEVYPELRYVTSIDEGMWLAPKSFEFMEPIFYLNHSCEPNLERVGGLIYVAKQNILSGQELTVDYAPLVTGLRDWSLECGCGSTSCRKVITAEDWKFPELAKKLWLEWLPHIQKQILKTVRVT